MSQLGRLAVRGAIFVTGVAVPAALAVAYYFGAAESVSFAYGVAVGLVVFASIALAVSLILGQRSAGKMALGAGIYVGRLMFAGVAIAVPVLLDLLPVLPMVGGFVGVYAVENIVLLQGARKLKSTPGAQES